MSITASRKFARILQKIGFHVTFSDFQVRNVVGTSSLGFPINLEKMAVSQKEFCNYEPEIFPGLVYRMLEERVVVLVFVTGKIVLTGAKSKELMDNAFRRIYPILFEHRKIFVKDS